MVICLRLGPFGMTSVAIYDNSHNQALAFAESWQYLFAQQAQEGGKLFSERSLRRQYLRERVYP